MSKTLVEEMLPARLILDIGIYLQSAAHLELAIWQIVMVVEKVDQSSVKQLTSSLETKKITRRLVKALRCCSSKCHPSIGIRISALAGEIERGLEVRNLAAHGAFYCDDDSESIGVAHYFRRGEGSNKQWFEQIEKIPQRQVNAAIEDIDRLLREAVGIRTALTKGLDH